MTVSHVAGVPVRNQQTVDFARHYGVTVLTCQPADPASKGGVESSVKVAKADIVPKDTNLRAQYASFGEIEAACQVFMDEVNNREHRATRRKPVAMLAEEAPRLHRIPDTAHTVAFGLSRSVPENTPMVTFENGQYSVPAYLLGARVFVRSHGVGTDEQVIVVHHGSQGPVEVNQWGGQLLRVALKTIMDASELGGGQTIAVDAANPGLVGWYARHGFVSTGGDNLRPYMKVATARKYLGSTER